MQSRFFKNTKIEAFSFSNLLDRQSLRWLNDETVGDRRIMNIKQLLIMINKDILKVLLKKIWKNTSKRFFVIRKLWVGVPTQSNYLRAPQTQNELFIRFKYTNEKFLTETMKTNWRTSMEKIKEKLKENQ